MDFTSKDHVQNSVFHRWHVDFSITCGFSSEKFKDYVDWQRFKRKRKYKKVRLEETVRGERKSHQQRRERGKR